MKVDSALKGRRDVEWILPLDPADFLGPRTGLYRRPLVLPSGEVIDRSKPGPFADKAQR